MKIIVVAAMALALTGCGAAPRVEEDQFVVKKIDGAVCVIYRPGVGTVQGTQMECDFR